MWAFAALLIVATGMFPLQAVLGLGASHHDWEIVFYVVLGLVTLLTVLFTIGLRWQLFSLATLVVIGLWAYDLPKIGVEFMPPLDEGTAMDMPITVPRASVTETTDDLKARDSLLRQFPEVESVIGKSGRANTPTDPAPLEMVETFANFRPKEFWPKRAMKFEAAARQTRAVLAKLEEKGYVQVDAANDRDDLINDAAMSAIGRFDETMRALAVQRIRDFESDLGLGATRFAVSETVRRIRDADDLHWPKGANDNAEIDALTKEVAPANGKWLAKNPALEDVTRLTREVAQRLADRQFLKTEPAQALALKGEHGAGNREQCGGVRRAAAQNVRRRGATGGEATGGRRCGPSSSIRD